MSDDEGAGHVTKPSAVSSINIEEWLAKHKLSKALRVFEERDVSLEELMDFNEPDLAEFGKDLGLDTLARKRFVKAVRSLQPERPKGGGDSGGGNDMDAGALTALG